MVGRVQTPRASLGTRTFDRNGTQTAIGKAYRATLLAAVTSFFLFNVAAIVAYNLPANPLTAPIDGALRGYMRPWLSQGWSIFAPTPGGDDEIAYVRYRLGPRTITPWIGLNRLFPPAMQNDPFSTASLDRRILYAMLDDVYPRPGVRREPSSHAELAARPVDGEALSDRQHALVRFGLAIAGCLPEVRDARRIESVQVAVYYRHVESFSHKFALRGFREPADDTTSSTAPALILPWVRAERVSGIRGLPTCA